jgi:CDP-alcohol phosphatidyltransferase
MPDIKLLRSAIKTKDGWWASIFAGPLANRLLEPIADIPAITPNRVTIFSFFVGLGAGYFFTKGDPLSLALGAVLVQLSFTVDCMDGQLARYRQQFSKLGAWLDRISDRVKDFVYFFSLAWGFFHQHPEHFQLGLNGLGDLISIIMGKKFFLLPVDLQVFFMHSIQVPSWIIWPLAMTASFSVFLIDYYVNQDMKLEPSPQVVSESTSSSARGGLVYSFLNFGLLTYKKIPILRFNIGEQSLLITAFCLLDSVFFLNLVFASLGIFYAFVWPILKLKGLNPEK